MKDQTPRSCCCDREPALSSMSEPAGKERAAAPSAVLAPTLELAPAIDVARFIESHFFYNPSPPLNLLHCVWLC
jgi:hypothetical protein